jgi:hypothetical protein
MTLPGLMEPFPVRWDEHLEYSFTTAAIHPPA